MRSLANLICLILVLAFGSAVCLADEHAATDDTVRVLSWNISDHAFVSEPQAFQSLLGWADPDVVLLDEVAPSANVDDLMALLETLRPGDDDAWYVSVGPSGGRQRGVIASRQTLEALPELSSILAYPESDRQRIVEKMSAADRANPGWSMAGGIPVNGAIVVDNGRRFLVVIADLQCCGDGPESWQELRRRVEARAIRALLRRVLERTSVDGIVLAGDFNMVNSTFPMTILAGPLPGTHSGLIPAELYHYDGASTWTWDGRGTPFPSDVLDYQLYSPDALRFRSGFILDTEGLPNEILDQNQLEGDMARRTGRHRPLLIEYQWK